MIKLTWLGQAGFRIELDHRCLLVDPWLSGHELRAIPVPPMELAVEGVDWLLVTHEHIDHLDLPLLPRLFAASPHVRVVVPEPVVPLLDGIVPPDRIRGVSPGDVLDLDGLPLHVVPAYHGLTMEDAYGDGSAIDGRARFVGYVLGSSPTVYHAGDTILCDDLVSALVGLGVDLALLPINGRDEAREATGLVGNLDPAEAVELALAIGATTLLPCHWDGFVGNMASPGDAVDAASARLHVVVPARCVPLHLYGGAVGAQPSKRTSAA